ncbi:hypothetical protein HY416_03245 [Candidatus Kaiserbacteria bacterium]|nr:hypothetical protein [Candidatus Kaiserbacteria bacterium]
MYREIRGLHEAAYILALFALGSQLLALVRDKLLAYQFGASDLSDIYWAAFRVPDLLFAIFASVLSVYVLIPFVAERMLESTSKARDLLSAVFTWFLFGYGAAAALIALFAHTIIAMLFPGFDAAEQTTMVLLMRVLLLQAFFLSLSNLFGVVTQLHRKFVLYAISPLLYNLGIILGIVVLYPLWGLSGIALGAMLGAVLHLGIQIPFVIHSGLAPRVVWRVDVRMLATIAKSSLPRALALTLQQCVLLAITSIATLMASGSVTVLQYAYNLQAVPLTIIGVSYSVAAFPTLARLYSEGDRITFLQHVYAALRHIIFWSIPITALFVVIRAQLVRVIYGAGAFDWSDTRLTAAVLSLFVISLVAQSVHLLIVRAYYAAGNTRTPLVTTALSSAGIVCVALLLHVFYAQTPAFAFVLASVFRVENVPGTEVLVLPLAFSGIFLVHSVILVYLFMRHYGREALGDLVRVLLQSCGAGIAISATAYICLNILVDGFRTDTVMGVFLQGFIAGTIALFAGALFLFGVDNRESKEIWRSFHRRFWKVSPIVPQEKE